MRSIARDSQFWDSWLHYNPILGIVNIFFTNFGKYFSDNESMGNEICGKAIVERLNQLGELKEYTLYCGIPSSTISNWKTRNSSPKISDIVKIAQYKNVSIEWLITGHDPEGLTEEDRNLLNMYHLLDERDKEDVLGIIEGKLERSTSRQEAGTASSGHAG